MLEIRLTYSFLRVSTVFDEKYVFLNIIDESVEKHNMSDL